MLLYRKDKLSIRELTPSDERWLFKWLNDPLVLQYYEGRNRPHDLEMVRKHFYHNELNETRCIIEYEGKEIGYIQFYLLDEEDIERYGYSSDETIFGTDQFIGEPDYWNRGIGQLLVRSMVEYLMKEKEADKIVMDPQEWNVRAITCYEKCGFVKKKFLPAHELHEGEMKDCWLMEYAANITT